MYFEVGMTEKSVIIILLKNRFDSAINATKKWLINLRNQVSNSQNKIKSSFSLRKNLIVLKLINLKKEVLPINN
jgi:hypothetical protein